MHKITRIKFLLVLLLLFSGLKTHAFDLLLTKTDETCTGNGALQFTITNPQPGATFIFKIYKHPDLVNPIAVVSTNSFGGLQSGTYRVIAQQDSGGTLTTQFRDIEILSAIVPITFTLSGVNAFCGPDGQISVTITAGSASLYELLSGPVIRPPQPSPVFGAIPAGVYQIRVFDTCGEGFVQNFTLLSDSVVLNIGNGGVQGTQLPSCNTISVANPVSVLAPDAIPYPLQAEFTVFPPDGSTPVVVNTTIPAGNPLGTQAGAVIPFFHNQTYQYNIKLTDPCGNQYVLNNNIVNAQFSTSIGPVNAPCQQFYLALDHLNFVPPLTVTFTGAPAGFVPENFNVAHPTFAQGTITYGSDAQPVPFGTYSVSVTDACGRTDTAVITLIPPPNLPDVIVELTGYPGCQDLGVAEISIAGFTIVSATLTVVPEAYPQAAPIDVSSAIIDGEVRLDPLPSGDYVIVLVDDCGNTYTEPFTVPPGGGGNVVTSSWPGCETGKGSIRLTGAGSTLVQATLVQAPAGSGLAAGSDVSIQISNGTLFMAGLVPGTYVFDLLDSCGNLHAAVNVAVAGYQVIENNHEVTRYCGSFDLELTHSANGVSPTYWLQKLVAGVWTHPQTGAPYVEGTVPTNATALSLTNNAINYNFGFTGTFRVLKRFQSFANGQDGGGFQDCFETLAEFDFNDGFEITGLERLTCDGQFSDIAIYTNGVPPLTYKIKSKNGDTSFVVDNGNSNIFEQLESTTYEFEVQHACGHIRNIMVNIGNLPSVAQVPSPDDIPPLMVCADAASGEAVFNLTVNNSIILGSQNPANYTITYYLSQTDAANATNAIPTSITSAGTTVYVRLGHLASSCFAVTSFDLIAQPIPVLDFATLYPVCQGESVVVSAPAGMVLYQWSDGQTGPSATFSQPGNYTLTVSNGFCEAEYPFTVTPSAPPVIASIKTTDWTDQDNTISVSLSNPQGEYLYSIDGVNFQESGVFENLLPGAYTVYVLSEACGMMTQNVFLLMYPRFFTPNGDGFNDFWRVKFAEAEPGLKTFVFDRYGKLITSILPDAVGWDGTLNGRMLPSTDYWFVVVRENGIEHRGHFSMKR